MYNPPGRQIYDTPLMLQLIEMLPRLKPALRKVADCILSDPLHAATLKIAELGALSGTSAAAVNRLAKGMGLDGYTGLRVALVANLRDWVSPISSVRTELQQLPDDRFTLEQQVRLAKGNLDAIMDTNTAAAFEASVAALDTGRRIYILGLGNSFYLGCLFADMLAPFRSHTTVVSSESGLDVCAHRIAPIGPDDVLIALSFPPHPRETVHLARYAKNNGACVVGLTDAPMSPLVTIADHVLYAPPAHAVLINSRSSLLNVIEALVAALSLRQIPRISEAQDKARMAQRFMQGEGQIQSAAQLSLVGEAHELKASNQPSGSKCDA